MNIYVNELLQDVPSKKIYRILWIDENNKLCFLIDILDEKALPFSRSVDGVTDDIAQESFRKVKKESINVSQSPSEIEIEKRDKAWQTIKDIVTKGPDIFVSYKRGKLVKWVIEKHGITKRMVYIYLRKYWQRGKTPNALLPDYKNSGGRGKNKAASSLKRGKPRLYDTENGMNVDESIRKLLRLSVEKFYFTDKKVSLSEAYRMMIKKYFVDDYYYEDDQPMILIKEQNQVPTERQFRYWFKKEFSAEKVKRKRLGNRMYEKDHRAVLGSSTPSVRCAYLSNTRLFAGFHATW